jgi:gamma-glutamylcyclotransferase (GGCT)/AIG2-like uncharacterized protein YtfP
LPDRLFVYGTLRPGHAPGEIADAVRTLEPVGPGTICGRLYNLGAYPGVVLDDDAGEEVRGEVFLVPHPETLVRLDAYEDDRPHDPENSLFRRVTTTVTLGNGARVLCWVYVYNQGLQPSLPRASD